MTAPPYWTTDTWQVLPHYQCIFCPFDALDVAVITAHVAEKHPLDGLGGRETVLPPSDRYGNPL